MNNVLIQFSPIFCPKLGEDQKKSLHSNLVRFFWVRAKNKGLRLSFVCSKLLPNVQRGGGGGIPQFCILIYANYTILATQRGPWPNGLPKDAPDRGWGGSGNVSGVWGRSYHRSKLLYFFRKNNLILGTF